MHNRTLAGVIGVEVIRGTDVIRHFCVKPRFRKKGVGTVLLQSLIATTENQILVRPCTAVAHAVPFFEAHGFELQRGNMRQDFLARYWDVNDYPAIDTAIVKRSSMSQLRVEDFIANYLHCQPAYVLQRRPRMGAA